MPKRTKRKTSKAPLKRKRGHRPDKPVHRWRLCPPGDHFREATIVSAYEKKDGTVVHEHPRSSTCVKNPSRKDQLYPEEIREIVNRNFIKFEEQPLRKIAHFGEKGQQFDALIRGWTLYWNEVLVPDIPLWNPK